MGKDNASRYFELDEDGYLIGYRIEEFDYDGKPLVPVTMETLHNGRVLFLCNNLLEWFPTHFIHLKKFQLSEVKFKHVPAAFFKSYEKYHGQWNYTDLTHEKTELSVEAKALVDEGVRLFITDKYNDKKEHTEAFLVNPKDYVVSIKEVIYSFIIED